MHTMSKQQSLRQTQHGKKHERLYVSNKKYSYRSIIQIISTGDIIKDNQVIMLRYEV